MFFGHFSAPQLTQWYFRCSGCSAIAPPLPMHK